MTLILGVQCSEGIVLGADGAVTLAGNGQETIRQETSKLDILGDGHIVVGVAGFSGLALRIKGEIEALWMERALGQMPLHDAMKTIQETLWQKHIGPSMQIAQVAERIIGQSARNNTIASTVVALPLRGVLHLLTIEPDGAPDLRAVTVPFVAVGSGQMIADPFLAFLRDLFWTRDSPSLNDGIFSTVWTLKHAIRTNPGGISDPMQIVVLENVGTGNEADWKARQLIEDELREHQEAVEAHEESLKQFHRLKNDDIKGAASPPEPN